MVRTRSRRIIKSCYFATNVSETTHYQQSNKRDNGVCLRPYYYDLDDMLVKFNEGSYFINSYFSEDLKSKPHNIKSSISKVKRWDDDNQFRLYQESMTWMAYRGSEMYELCFKSERASIQKSVKCHG